MVLYDFHIEDISGNPFDLESLSGKKVLLINTASECGFTKQYPQLQDLYEHTDRSKFEIIGFPSNDFGSQEPGTNEEIAQFCTANFGVKFPMMSKISVKGNSVHPIFSWLKSETGEEPKWNFHKYLIDRNGNVLRSLEAAVEPTDSEILDWINQ
jgi:glutathione peroxidase|tara:strand:- start:20863 stop:21324 length:462 start_codon:yes stop_codon:yes gene_type:complete